MIYGETYLVFALVAEFWVCMCAKTSGYLLTLCRAGGARVAEMQGGALGCD